MAEDMTPTVEFIQRLLHAKVNIYRISLSGVLPSIRYVWAVNEQDAEEKAREWFKREPVL